MTSRFHRCDERPRRHGWWFALMLVAVLGVSGCKNWGSRAEGVHDEPLRANSMSETARQARVNENPDADHDPKSARDPWMSDEAQEISRHLQ